MAAAGRRATAAAAARRVEALTTKTLKHLFFHDLIVIKHEIPNSTGDTPRFVVHTL